MANYLNNFQTNAMPPINTVNPVAPLPQQGQMPMMQAPQLVFPQPVGNVYNLNNSNEIGNVPTGVGITLGLCLNENLLYIKTLQNNVPALLAYKLVPFEGYGQQIDVTTQTAATMPQDDDIKQLKEEVKQLKELLTKKVGDGGAQKWQL